MFPLAEWRLLVWCAVACTSCLSLSHCRMYHSISLLFNQLTEGLGHNAVRLQLKLVVSISWMLVMLDLSTGMLNLVTLDKVSTSKSYTLESSLWNSSTTISICKSGESARSPLHLPNNGKVIKRRCTSQNGSGSVASRIDKQQAETHNMRP